MIIILTFLYISKVNQFDVLVRRIYSIKKIHIQSIKKKYIYIILTLHYKKLPIEEFWPVLFRTAGERLHH